MVWLAWAVVALVVLWCGWPNDRCAAAEAGGFASYLKSSGLPALYLTELQRLCLEEGDLDACAECVDLLNHLGRFDEAMRLADAMVPPAREVDLASRLLKSSGLYAAGKYRDAWSQVDTVVAMFPERERLAEAVLLRSRCQLKLGSPDEALLGLRQIEPYVVQARRAEYLLDLAQAEETAGDLTRALKIYQDAWKKGSVAAGLGLVRCHLRQGRVEAGLEVAREAAKRNQVLPSRGASDLALDLGDALPGLWQVLMKHALSDTAFSPEANGGVVGSILRLAEAGERVGEICETLLERAGTPASRQALRYARALALGETGAVADSLALLLPGIDDPGLRARCFTALVGLAPERKADAVRALGPGLRAVMDQAAPDERVALLGALLDAAPDLAATETGNLLGGLKAGPDDRAMAEIAAVLEAVGRTAQALEVYDAVAQSPVISRTSLACEKRAYLVRHLARPDVDIAREVEKIAGKDASDLELGDFFAEKLRDYQRASVYYAKAVEAPPKGADADAVSLKLARALALASYGPADTVAAADPGERRRAALAVLTSVAGSKSVPAEAVLLVTKICSDWLAREPEQVVEIAGKICQRKDLGAAPLATAAGMVGFIYIDRQGNYYERSSTLLGRVTADFAGSKQAPLAAFTLARARFTAGDYQGALEGFQACGQRSRDPVLASLCKVGAGDCYLASGGLAVAADYFRQAGSCEAAYRAGRCYELLGLPDSSLAWYRVSLAGCAPAALAYQARLRIALTLASRGAGDQALESMDSPFFETRKPLAALRPVAAAYALGRAGYRALGADLLRQAAPAWMDVTCQVHLLVTDLIGDDDPAGAYAILAAARPEAGNVFEEYAHSLNLAKLACSSAGSGACDEDLRRFETRYPLDTGSLSEIGTRRMLALLEHTSGAPSQEAVDSLLAAGNLHPLVARLVYGRGVSLLLEGDHPGARDVFGQVVRTWPDSDLHGDACFKLGSVYYLMGVFDSSAVYFGLAARSGRPSLARDALFNRGLALEEAGDLSQAAEAYATLAVRFPLSDSFERGIVRCGFCLQGLGRPAEAAAWYAAALRYAVEPEAQAETRYWIAEAAAESGDHNRAACEFLRTAYLYPKEDAWAGTAAYNAGMECEAGGLGDHALVIYQQNVRRFGKTSDWGRASAERLAELLKAPETQ